MAPPPILRLGEWERVTAGDDTRWHWDAWPHPGFGTVEISDAISRRTCAARPASPRSSRHSSSAVAGREHEPYDRDLYAVRRAAAAAGPPDAGDVGALAELVEPAARNLGTWPAVQDLFRSRPEAERQLELGPPAAVRDLAGRSAPQI